MITSIPDDGWGGDIERIKTIIIYLVLASSMEGKGGNPEDRAGH